MSLGDVHELAPDLRVIEGHHPHVMWEDPDIPSIAVYRRGATLYLLDTGVGPAQRQAILDTATQWGPFDEVVVLNSHGHLDHLGNNSVLDEIPARRRVHHISRDARPAIDSGPFFAAMYERGLPYFDYLDGLRIDPAAARSVLVGLGAPAGLTNADAEALTAAVETTGLRPVLAELLPAAVIRLLLKTYPPTYPRVAGMVDYQDLAPAGDLTIGEIAWPGWSFGDGSVLVLQAGGHSAGGCVFLIPDRKFLMLADETSTAPIWADSDPRRTVEVARRAGELMAAGAVDTICAGHNPMRPLSGPAAAAALDKIVDSERDFRTAVEDAIDAGGATTIDRLYHDVVTAAMPGSMIDTLHRLQFPVFATFLKLTLLNHCLLHDYPTGTDAAGSVTFTLPA